MKILKKQKLTGDIHLIELQSPEIAKKAKPGHFMLIQLTPQSARVPIPIANAEKNIVTLIFNSACKQTKDLASAKKNQEVYFALGPLGNARAIKQVGKIILVGEGAGIGPMYFYAKALKEVGNRIITLVGGVTKKTVFWEDKIKKVSDKFFVIDPKSDFKCPLTHAVEQVVRKIKIDEIITIGSPEMMKSVANTTKLRSKTYAYLTATMLDGIGMCGSCRIHAEGVQKLCCINGPEFDAHTIDWNSYMHRLQEYQEHETILSRIR